MKKKCESNLATVLMMIPHYLTGMEFSQYSEEGNEKVKIINFIIFSKIQQFNAI